MSLTSISQVRAHLSRFNPGDGEVRNHPLRLTSDRDLSLPHAHVVVDSETVKAVANDIPASEVAVLAEEPIALGQSRLVPETIVCADNSSLAHLYQENVDFAIDYASGKIRRLAGGAIESGSSVTVWYLYYRVYGRGEDYTIDYDAGLIRRRTGGALAEGQEVLIDYRLGNTDFADGEIEQCITEAEAEIAHITEPDHLESTDPALQAAATFLALALLCRNAAGMMASETSGGQKQTVWLELEKSYRENAQRLLGWFRRQTPDRHHPRLA